MRRLLTLSLWTLLVGGLAAALPQAAKKQAMLRCTLTDKKIENCCCQKRDGKLYCTLAKKTIDKCCCEPSGTPKERKAS